MEIATAIVGLIAQLATLYENYQTALAAADQATLDTISAQIVAASNTLAPTGGDPAVIVNG